MKICIAQTKSLSGKVQANMLHQLRGIERAHQAQADAIFFPELSITNYEPELAEQLATDVQNNLFNPFQAAADQYKMTIGIGMPTKATHGIYISMLIFQPKKERQRYAKQILHADELPYFVGGDHQTLLQIKGKKIAIGICYETLQRPHFLQAHQQGADIYVASVAKPKGGVEKAYAFFPNHAKEFKTPILMANSVGMCDNFLSVGQSAAWNKNGKLMAQLEGDNEGFLIYDAVLETTVKLPQE